MDMKLYRLLFLIFIVSFGATAAPKGQSAAQVLSRCAATLNSAGSLSAKFTITTGDGKYPCAITMSKQRYCLDMPQMKVWFDGTTQWTFAKSSQQLSITEPTADELMESNPFAILNHWDKAYKCRMLQSERGMTVVELVPKTPVTASVHRAVVSVNPATSLPSKIVVTLSNGRTFTATITSISVGKALPASTFTFDKQKYKAVETIDLR